MMHTLMAISGKTLIDSMKFGSVDENSLVYLSLFKVVVKNQVHPVWTITNSLTVEVFAWYQATREMHHSDVHVSVQGSFASTEWSSYLVAHEIIWHTAHPGVREIAERNKAAFLNGSSNKRFPAEKMIFPVDLLHKK
jgi:hypothetical protein